MTVLFLTASGVGKEIFSHNLHQPSRRADGPVAVNCASIPEQLIESELFGVEKAPSPERRCRGPAVSSARPRRFALLDEVIGTPSFTAQAVPARPAGGRDRAGRRSQGAQGRRAGDRGDQRQL